MRAAFIPLSNITHKSERLRAGAIAALIPENYKLGNNSQPIEWSDGERGFLIHGEDTDRDTLDKTLRILGNYLMPGEEITIPEATQQRALELREQRQASERSEQLLAAA